MIVVSNLPGRRRTPIRPAGSTLWASLDVEWTKNYRIKNGNVPFCFSVVYVAVPDNGTAVDVARLPFTYTSVYVEDSDETAALITAADAAVRDTTRVADRITGHQLSSDLSVLANASRTPLSAVAAARDTWQERKKYAVGKRRIVDTRYDADHVLTGHSRRLVDVCTDLGLDVTQPELLRTSMTALHRAYLDTGSVEARERISVLKYPSQPLYRARRPTRHRSSTLARHGQRQPPPRGRTRRRLRLARPSHLHRAPGDPCPSATAR